MKVAIPLILLALTLGLIVVGPLWPGRFSGTVGIAAGEAIPGLGTTANTPEQAITNFLADVQKRNWDALPHWLSATTNGTAERDLLTKELGGTTAACARSQASRRGTWSRCARPGKMRKFARLCTGQRL